ncbi:MAG: c-type cytochrome [FCB group bacterium]|nr:c-type cytochrome [FCB group bacterium]
MNLKIGLFCLAALGISVVFSQTDPGQYFKANCKVCHTIGGGRLVGPDLKGVEERKDRPWLVQWIMDPAGVLASGDAYAAKLLREANGAAMTPAPGINETLAGQLLDYIKTQSVSGAAVADSYVPPTFTTDDIIAGKNLFLGKKKLANGAAPCVSCHNINSMFGLGGGKLGHNLTGAYKKLGEVRGLTNWLKLPPVPTMNPIFSKRPLTETEIISLTAFLKNEAETASAPTLASIANFILYGALATLLLFVLIGGIWNRRFMAVRKPMVSAGKYFIKSTK